MSETADENNVGHHPNCYQNTGVPDDMPAGICDCRVLRMFPAATRPIPPGSGDADDRPPHRNLFGLDWEYNPRARRFRRFGVSDGSRGVGNYANPLTAYLALRRWRKEPARPAADTTQILGSSCE